MRVVVTGGLGALGSQVVRALREQGHQPVVASRRTGVDLTTGTGLAAVLERAEAVVHTADTTNPRAYAAVTLGGTERVADAAAQATGRPHVVYISIVGVDATPFAYYRRKLAAEQALQRAAEAGGAPTTVLRATQFHSLAALFVRAGRVGPVAFGLRGMQIQPVDIAWVGSRLAEIATGPRPAGFDRARDIAGPDRLGVAQIARLVAEHEGRTPARALGLPAVGATMRAFADGGILPGPDADLGGERFVDWLTRQPHRLRGR